MLSVTYFMATSKQDFAGDLQREGAVPVNAAVYTEYNLLTSGTEPHHWPSGHSYVGIASVGNHVSPPSALT